MAGVNRSRHQADCRGEEEHHQAAPHLLVGKALQEVQAAGRFAGILDDRFPQFHRAVLEPVFVVELDGRDQIGVHAVLRVHHHRQRRVRFVDLQSGQ